jgi:peptidoglycan hydrolase-like protein with peptidoglycan-binding domain
MKRIHLFTAAAILSLAGSLTVAAVPASATSRAPASAAWRINRSDARPTRATSASAAICNGTSLLSGSNVSVIRVPTITNGSFDNECNLLPSDVAGLVPVERLQIDLDDCYGAGLTVDGEYGPDTEAAVKAVQASEGVPQDGDYGPITIAGSATNHFLYQARDEPVGDCDWVVD